MLQSAFTIDFAHAGRAWRGDEVVAPFRHPLGGRGPLDLPEVRARAERRVAREMREVGGAHRRIAALMGAG